MTGAPTIPNDRLVAYHPNHVWALDFANDQTADCRMLKVLNVTDEFTKHALAIEVERSMTGDVIVTVLERLIIIHGSPGFVRMDIQTQWCPSEAALVRPVGAGSGGPVPAGRGLMIDWSALRLLAC